MYAAMVGTVAPVTDGHVQSSTACDTKTSGLRVPESGAVLAGVMTLRESRIRNVPTDTGKLKLRLFGVHDAEPSRMFASSKSNSRYRRFSAYAIQFGSAVRNAAFVESTTMALDTCVTRSL